MSEVTELLLQWNTGDHAVRDALVEAIYAELNIVASRQLRGERLGDLQPNALVHEAYCRLIDLNRIDFQGRAHFLAVAARIMREILIDKARKRNASKRDGGVQVTLSSALVGDGRPSTDVLTLHDALERLAEADPQRAHIVELRFFGGLTIEETAEVIGLSPATVKRSWTVARGWLYHAMNAEPGAREADSD